MSRDQHKWPAIGIGIVIAAGLCLCTPLGWLPLGLLSNLSPGEPVTVPGPESPELIQKISGSVVIAGWDRTTFIDLPSMKRKEVGSLEGGRVNSLSVESSGKAWIVVKGMMGGRHRIVELAKDGAATLTFDRPGDARWRDLDIHPTSRSMAVSRDGAHLAFLTDLSGIQLQGPQAYLMQGVIQILDPATHQLRSMRLDALDLGLSWFPDGRHLAYVGLADRSLLKLEGEFASTFTAPRVPAVHVLDTVTGKSRIFHVGWHPSISVDGEWISVSDNSRQHRMVHVTSGRSKPLAADGILGSPVALIDDDLALVLAHPTEGSADPPYVTSPQGPRPLLALKVVSTSSGKFATIAGGIDTLVDSVAFGAASARNR